MGLAFLVALKERDVKKCRMTDVFVFFELLSFLAACEEMWFHRRSFRCF